MPESTVDKCDDTEDAMSVENLLGFACLAACIAFAMADDEITIDKEGKYNGWTRDDIAVDKSGDYSGSTHDGVSVDKDSKYQGSEGGH